jgi:tetratricopeptide (TPR) repeat protein
MMEMGDAAGARPYFERAMAIDEAVFGLRHVNLIERLQDLGKCLKQLGEVDASADCFGRANELSRALPAAQVAAAAAELEASPDEAA